MADLPASIQIVSTLIAPIIVVIFVTKGVTDSVTIPSLNACLNASGRPLAIAYAAPSIDLASPVFKFAPNAACACVTSLSIVILNIPTDGSVYFAIAEGRANIVSSNTLLSSPEKPCAAPPISFSKESNSSFVEKPLFNILARLISNCFCISSNVSAMISFSRLMTEIAIALCCSWSVFALSVSRLVISFPADLSVFLNERSRERTSSVRPSYLAIFLSLK